jgi:hypothetical protein
METPILVPDFTKRLLNLGFPQETPGFHLQVAILKLKASDCPTVEPTSAMEMMVG